MSALGPMATSSRQTHNALARSNKRAPAALRRSAASPNARRNVVVRASGFDDAKNQYLDLSNKIPPVVTAAAVPVVGLSLLCKAITGSGLPGTLLGSIEGVSWLVLPLGAASLAPRVQDIIKGGDFSADAVLKILQSKSSMYGGFGEDSRGKNATERLNSLASDLDPNSQLGLQMQDIAKQKAVRDAETPEEKKAREELRAKLAAMALGLGNDISKDAEDDADTRGRDGLLEQPVTETLKDCMTTENYDVDVTEFDDKDLGSKLNLSSPDIEKGVPKNNAGDKWREQYRTDENAAAAAEDAPKQESK